ncbi:hypothetical protein [Methanosphaerula subterraneus]|uniref:hypothetical protein n=1 Tax=Methanosphaerula subterraneus TaxID=3350244 RepID=UPI003F83245C
MSGANRAGGWDPGDVEQAGSLRSVAGTSAKSGRRSCDEKGRRELKREREGRPAC